MVVPRCPAWIYRIVQICPRRIITRQGGAIAVENAHKASTTSPMSPVEVKTTQPQVQKTEKYWSNLSNTKH